MGQHLHFQHSFWDVIQEVTYHCIWTIISVGVILCDKRILERLRYPGSVLRVRVSPFCLPIFADVSIFTRNFYPFPRGNHGLHVKEKRVRVFSIYYLWAA
jgi:hypothetical protein